ncbi:MAG: hypothetical protein ACRDGM_19835 [bacterium]
MRTLWKILHRTIFWSYERGTWQYDVAVVVIVVFLLATPKSWFHDQPQVGSATPGQVELIKDDGASQTYRVDARALAPPMPTQQLDNELHNAMRKAVPDLPSHGFQIIRIEPVRDANGTVTAYNVQVKR